MWAIEMRGLRKVYGGRAAVDDLWLNVEQGEFFTLLGTNGAGKSSLMRMLCCASRPDGGDALLMGRSILREAGQVKACIGVAPQESSIAPRLSLRENLVFMAGLLGCGPREAKRRADAMIAEMDMEEAAAQRAGRLSGGWQRRLSIAMALMGDVKVLLLDEPTLGLDVLARRELWRLLEKLRGRVTVLMSTHYMEEARMLSDRVGILSRGRLLAQGTPAELAARAGTEDFEEAFVRLAGGEGV